MPDAVPETELADALALLLKRLDRDLAGRLGAGDFAANLLAHMRSTDPSRLLFTPANLAQIAKTAAERDPDEAAWTKEIADNALEWRFYGASNAHCRRFLALDREAFDFSSVEHEDPQTLHGLNRLRWFAALGKTYWQTGEARYFHSLMEHWDFFVSKVPFPGEEFRRDVHGMAPINMSPPFGELDTFIRLTNWYWAYWAALFAEEMTPERNAVLLARCLRLFDLVAGRGIKTHEHNFTSMQMEALFFWATALPGFEGMETWRHAARNILESSLNRAVYEDGVHWEKSAGYHAGCIRWYGASFLLGKRSGEPFAEGYGERLRLMAEFLDAVITPANTSPLLSDSDRSDGPRQALALVRTIFPDMRFCRAVAPSYLSVWAGDGEVWDAGEGVKPIAPCLVFPQGGVAVLRNAGVSGPQAILDNGPTHAGHSHFDNLTVHYELPEGPAIVDPGRWIYRSGADRAWAVHAESHNTAYIEDHPVGPEDWIRESCFVKILGPEDGRTGAIRQGEQHGCTTLATTFQGFAQDPEARVARLLVFPDDPAERWLAVVDSIRAPTAHNWTNSWLFPASEAGRETETGYELDLDCGLTLRFAFMGTTLLALRDEEKFWCPNYAEKSPARWVRFTSHCETTRRAFLFLPLSEDEEAMPDLEFDGHSVTMDTGTRRVVVEV